MNDSYIKEQYEWQDLLRIVHKLRQPDGCAWDHAQTYESMKQCVTNEAKEVVCAIESGDFLNLKEELGDLLLQVVMYADMAAEQGDFTLEEIVDGVSKKMIRRHPHVFGDLKSVEEQLKPITDRGVSRWNAIKYWEKQERLSEYEKLYREGRITEEVLKRAQDSLENFKKSINIAENIL